MRQTKTLERGRRFVLGCAVALGALLGAGTQAEAGVILIGADSGNSTEGLGNFTGSIEYNAIDAFTGTLIVTLTNTSPAANGGYITGFVFNIDSTDAGATATLSAAPAPTHPFLNTGTESAEPFGPEYDAGAALEANFLGGGDPSDGIAVGDTGIFYFLVEASDAGSLDAIDFINGPYEFDFIVRFRGFEDDGSDKVPVVVVPLPGALPVGLAGLAGLGLMRRRRRA